MLPTLGSPLIAGGTSARGAETVRGRLLAVVRPAAVTRQLSSLPTSAAVTVYWSVVATRVFAAYHWVASV